MSAVSKNVMPASSAAWTTAALAGSSMRRPNAARENLKAVNALWARCELEFTLDEYDAVSPDSFGLRFSTRDLSELQDIRRAFDSQNELLLVTFTRLVVRRDLALRP